MTITKAEKEIAAHEYVRRSDRPSGFERFQAFQAGIDFVLKIINDRKDTSLDDLTEEYIKTACKNLEDPAYTLVAGNIRGYLQYLRECDKVTTEERKHDKAD